MPDSDPIGRRDLVNRVKELLPEPIREEEALDGSTILVGGDPGEVVIRMTASRISIALFRVRWEGPYTPRVRPRQHATLTWNRLPKIELVTLLGQLVITATRMRRSSFRRCRICGKVNPPEWMRDREVCQACAERELGVVY